MLAWTKFLLIKRCKKLSRSFGHGGVQWGLHFLWSLLTGTKAINFSFSSNTRPFFLMCSSLIGMVNHEIFLFIFIHQLGTFFISLPFYPFLENMEIYNKMPLMSSILSWPIITHRSYCSYGSALNEVETENPTDDPLPQEDESCLVEEPLSQWRKML